MQQVARAIYLVQAGEVVTVEIEATKVGNFASLVIDGTSVPAINTAPLTFQFPVTVGPGQTHFGMVQCFFPQAAPDDAKFQVFVSGSAGGGRFEGSDIEKTDPTDARGIEFRRI